MNLKTIYTKFLIILLWSSFFNLARGNNLLYQADSLYIKQNYHEALNCYWQVLNNDQFLRQNFTINFKIGICYLRNNAYPEAKQVFARLKHHTDPIPEYTDYFLFLSSYGSDKPVDVIDQARQYIRTYPNHFLADSVLLRLADYEFKHELFEKAYRDYMRLSGKNKMKRHKPYLLGQMAFCSYSLDQEKKAMEGMYQVMKKYPSDRMALKIADLFLTMPSPSSKYEFAIGDVYLSHNHFQKLTERLETFIKESRDPVEKEKGRYYLIRIYYNKGQYQTALYGFKNLLPGLQDKSLESRIRLSIARSYLRLDEKNEAVEAYMDYAKRYPRRRMAVECVWKSNWIYEELGDLSEVINSNEYLLKHWPQSAYRKEAKFRIGLLHLRLQNYIKAENIFRSIRNTSKKSDFQHYRSSYWLAKTYEMSGKKEIANELFIDLGSELFESYYTLKSYVRFKSTIDTLLQIKEQLSDQRNPLRFHTQLMAPLMERFETLFLLRELLGDDFAMMELSDKKYYPKTLKEWISLAEVYKKLGAYNEAFRIYDYIDNKYYSDLTNLEKPFLLKESYPLYYDLIIGRYGRQRDLDKNLVLALIRAESSFNRRAHSWANAYGLMQIIPRTAKSLFAKLDMTNSEPETLFDPNINIKLGTLYLKDLLNQFDGTFEYAVAAYNAGPHRVSRWKKFKDASEIDYFVENIEYTQTRNYTRRVMKNYWIYMMLDGVN